MFKLAVSIKEIFAYDFMQNNSIFVTPYNPLPRSLFWRPRVLCKNHHNFLSETSWLKDIQDWQKPQVQWNKILKWFANPDFLCSSSHVTKKWILNIIQFIHDIVIEYSPFSSFHIYKS